MSEKASKIIGTIIGLILIPVLIGLGISCQRKHDDKFPWKGTFYRGINAERRILSDSEFKTLEECRAWSVVQADHNDLKEGEYDYSCGTGCSYKDDTVTGGKQVKIFECTELTK